MSLNDLPDEVLEQIFDNLDLYELKLASLVCRRWSTLTFSGQRMDRVWLVKHKSNCDFLFKTERNYRNIRIPWREDDQFESLVRLLHTPKPNVRNFELKCALTSEQLRLLLLKTPELQRVSIYEIEDDCEMNGPFPVLAKLKSLVLEDVSKEQFNTLRRSMPNLQSLHMAHDNYEVEAWKCLSGQLKVVHVDHLHLDQPDLHSFLNPTFPLLEDFAVGRVDKLRLEEMMLLSTDNDFFRRHPFLRRLSFDKDFSVKLVKSISRHCPELTYLHLVLKDPEEGYLESLVQLTKLKHLSLQGIAVRKMFRGAFKLLESVALDVVPPRVLLENLSEVAPRLNYLKLDKCIDSLEVQFICERFSCLQHLQVGMKCLTAANNSVRFEKLANLQELTLWIYDGIRYIHSSNVRCLTMLNCAIEDDKLKQIPTKFPLLKRLSIDSCFNVSMSSVKRLHKLMPSCRIDYDKKRFYPR